MAPLDPRGDLPEEMRERIVWRIHDPQQGLTNVRGKVLLALWDTFKENGVQIPYPHREIIMRRRESDRPVEGKAPND